MTLLLATSEIGKFWAIRELRLWGASLETDDGLGQRLRRLRLERRLSQRELAHPYSAALVSQIENDRKTASSDVLALFAKKLGVTPDELAHGAPSASEPEVVDALQHGWRHVYSGSFAHAERAFKTAIRLAKRGNHHTLHGDAVAGLARCFERRGQNDDALRLYKQADGLFRTHAASSARAEAVAGIARCHQMSGQTRLALHVLETYLLELEVQRLPEPRALMRVNASLVWPYTELGLHDKANDAANRALNLQASVNDPEEIARMHLNAARALLNSGRSEEALDSLRRAEEIFRDLNWDTEIARARTNRGIVLMNQGDLVGAEEALRAARETFRAVGFVRSEARNLNELARLARLSGRLDESERLARQALELLKEMEAAPELALTHRELGLAIAVRDPVDAERHLRAAVDLYERCGEVDHAADTCRLLGDLKNSNEAGAGADDYRRGLLLLAPRLDRADQIPATKP